MSQESALAESLIRGPFIGTMIALILYGITCLQAFFYFQTYTHDHKVLKSTVTLVLVLETVHVVLSISLLDYYLIKNYGQVQVIQAATWVSTSMYIVGLFIDLIVYLYFTWRISAFTENGWIVTLMLLIGGSRTFLQVSVLFPAYGASLARHDILSASIMAYYLYKTRVGLRRADLLVNRLLVFVVATGVIVVVVDVIALMLTAFQKDTLAFLGAVIVQTRLYTNSLLTSLNVRNAHLRAFHNAGNRETSSPALPTSPPSLRFADASDLSGGTVHRHSGVSSNRRSGESWHTAREIATGSQPELDGAV